MGSGLVPEVRRLPLGFPCGSGWWRGGSGSSGVGSGMVLGGHENFGAASGVVLVVSEVLVWVPGREKKY
jgi:hypothetical protein